MSVYKRDGSALSFVYNKNGLELAYAYDKLGNVIHIAGDTPTPEPRPDYSSYSYIQKWASKGISSTQGFGIYDDKVFWISKSGDSTVDSKCYVFNLSDGSQALANAYITAYTGHGNSISMDFPKMYSATAYSGGKVHISTFSNDFLTNTLDKTLVLPTTTANEQIYGCDACLDENDKTILWSIHHTSGTSDRDTPWRVRKWDLTTLTNNGDGTYTPLLLADVSLVQPANSFYFQGCAMHDGILWFANGYSGSSTIAYVFGVNPNTGEYLYYINCETTAEPEGVAWVEDSNAVGGYAMYVGFQGMELRKYTFEELDVKSIYYGKKMSILGDSISTFAGYIPSGNSNFYTGSNCGVSVVGDTWWKKLSDALGMTIELNESWSGSRVTTTNGETSAGCMTRCQNLGTSPDVIIVYMGINDFNNEVALGIYDGNGTFPSVTTTFREAYAIMLNKILTAYPRAEVWCATLPSCERNSPTGAPEINANGVLLDDFNKAIRNLAQVFGAKVLEHAQCGLTYQNMSVYMGDWASSSSQGLHPNANGHSLIANNDIRQMDASIGARYAII